MRSGQKEHLLDELVLDPGVVGVLQRRYNCKVTHNGRWQTRNLRNVVRTGVERQVAVS